jgi:4-amino-4-deoxy-L-arabinose transferase-like glycosyltransferase
MPKRTFIFLFILGIGLVLRLIAINQSLWLDEAISVQTAKNYSFWQILTIFALKDFNPPLYYLILHLWLKIFPATEFFVRLPSLIFALLTGIVSYKIVLLLFKEEKTALVSLLFLITSPLHIYYSQEARMYSLATFSVAASMYFFIKLLKKGGWGNIVWYLVFSAFMLYSHYLTWFILMGQMLYSLFYKRRLLVYILVLLGTYLPWLRILLSQLRAGSRVSENNPVWKEISGSLSFKAVALIPVKFIIGRITFENKYLYFLLVIILLAFFTFLLGKAFTLVKKKDERLIWWWACLPIIFGMIVSIKVPVLSYFRFLYCLPAFYILLGRGVGNLKCWRTGFIVLVVAINLSFSLQYLLNSANHRENWQQAVTVLNQKNYNKAPVLLLTNVRAPFDYYDEQQSRVIPTQDKELIANENIIWFIPYAQPIFDPKDLIRQFLKIKGFVRTDEEHFRGVTLERWEKALAIKYPPTF